MILFLSIDGPAASGPEEGRARGTAGESSTPDGSASMAPTVKERAGRFPRDSEGLRGLFDCLAEAAGARLGGQEPLDEAGVVFAREEARRRRAPRGGRGCWSGCPRSRTRPARAASGAMARVAVLGVDDQLGQQRVVVGEDDVVLVGGRVDPHPEPARDAVAGDLPRRGREGDRVLGVDPALDGVARAAGCPPAGGWSGSPAASGSARGPGRRRSPSRSPGARPGCGCSSP